MIQQPFFYDVTLRDGNQALKKPWNTTEKEIIFKRLLDLNVQGIEIGFPAASEMDFEACSQLAAQAPEHVTISVLARANRNDVKRAAQAVQHAARPRIHTFIAMNPRGLKHVLKKDIETVTDIAVDAVKYAKSLLPANGQVEFSVEHFGDCQENLPAVINAIQQVVAAGADVINLPNTVERFRPLEFVNMVKAVKEAIGDKAVISVHCHNDLGMATATTVESYFAGATQLETTLNGLGERAGNTNMYEVAVALYNSNVRVPLNLEKFAEVADLVAQMSDIPIWEKSPIIGSDVLSHRSGIHQDGANKTKGCDQGQYIAFDPKIVGRDGEHIGFTSQSGKSALCSVYQSMKYPLTMEEAEELLPFAKKEAEVSGELTPKQLDTLYRKHVCDIKGPYEFKYFEQEGGESRLHFNRNGQAEWSSNTISNPIESCVRALASVGVAISIEKYHQQSLNEEQKEAAEALTTIELKQGEKTVMARAIDHSTKTANIRAIFNGLNKLERGH